MMKLRRADFPPTGAVCMTCKKDLMERGFYVRMEVAHGVSELLCPECGQLFKELENGSA